MKLPMKIPNQAKMLEDIIKLKRENDRLNNIINELERLLKQELDTIRNDEFFCNLTNEDYIEFILDKLKKLKEGKDNENI